MKNTGAIIGLVIIAGTLGFAGTKLKTGMMSLVTFAEATQATDTTVQIMGAPVDGTMYYDNEAHELRFAIRDETGSRMPVVFKGPKPEDLDSAMVKATKITAQGTYSPEKRVFTAENLLVKCPSKYQGVETEQSYGRA